MKKILIIIGSILIVNISAQNISSMRGDTVTLADENDTLVFTSQKPEKPEKSDTTRIRLGNKGITIVEKDGKTTVDIKSVEDTPQHYNKEIEKEGVEKNKFDWKDKKDGWNSKKKKSSKNNAHWEGFGFGFNGLMTKDYKLASSDSTLRYLDLNTEHSYNYTFNFEEKSLKIFPFMYLVTGLGIDMSYYRFEHNNNIHEVNGKIVEKPAHSNAAYGKSRLYTSYFNVPLLIEFKIPFDEHPVHISGGVVGGIKMWASSKEVYYINGDRHKDKYYNDFNLNLVRYGYRAQIGYNHFSIYANYYPVSLFESNRGPQVYPFNIGILFQ